LLFMCMVSMETRQQRTPVIQQVIDDFRLLDGVSVTDFSPCGSILTTSDEDLFVFNLRRNIRRLESRPLSLISACNTLSFQVIPGMAGVHPCTRPRSELQVQVRNLDKRIGFRTIFRVPPPTLRSQIVLNNNNKTESFRTYTVPLVSGNSTVNLLIRFRQLSVDAIGLPRGNQVWALRRIRMNNLCDSTSQSAAPTPSITTSSTRSDSPSPTTTPTPTASSSKTPSLTLSYSLSRTASRSFNSTLSTSVTITRTPSNSPTVTRTISTTPSFGASQTPSRTPVKT